MLRSKAEDGPDMETCEAMLSAVGFRYVADFSCWVHGHHERVISMKTVAAHDEDWLGRWITDG